MEQRMLKRDQLGETFGTRKAKSRIKAVERNKVDAEAQAGVKDHLLSSIEVAAQNIPTAGELTSYDHQCLYVPVLNTMHPEQKL
jgi:DNA-directed RNA polymerase I subunit RPA49